MAIDTDYVQSMATQLAQFEIQGQLAKANRNEANYKAQQSAINQLDSALKTFKSAASSLKSGGSLLVNSAKFSQEGYATASVTEKAVDGSYDFFVERLASKSQVALVGLSDANMGSGELTLGQNGASFSIDLNGIDSLDKLAAAINDHADNKGIKATLVRSEGQINLVLSSTKTGADQAISVSGSGNGALQTSAGNPRTLSEAADALVRLGGANGIELTNSSNTFDNVIDGVSLTFTKTHKDGELLTLDVAQDKNATKGKAQSFLTALNSLFGTFDTLTASGSDSSARGVLAGDSSIRSIESMLNSAVRTQFDGVSLLDFGISADRSGKLVIDTARFEKAVAANPEGLDKLFTDKGALLETLDKNLNVYTTSAGGVMANRKETLNAQLRRVDQEFDTIQKQYDNYYNRYLRQYTTMMQTMSSMEQTYGMF